MVVQIFFFGIYAFYHKQKRSKKYYETKEVQLEGKTLGQPVSTLTETVARGWYVETDLSRELACSPMVGRSSGTLPTRVQILVLASFLGIFLGFTIVIR